MIKKKNTHKLYFFFHGQTQLCRIPQHLTVCNVPAGGVMLYLPEGNHCGGSFGPAWVASSWVWTLPTLSYHPAPTGTADPVLLTGRKRILHPQKTLSKPLGVPEEDPWKVSPRDRVSLHRATAAATGSQDCRSPARTPNMTSKMRKNALLFVSVSFRRGFLRVLFLPPDVRLLTDDGKRRCCQWGTG